MQNQGYKCPSRHLNLIRREWKSQNKTLNTIPIERMLYGTRQDSPDLPHGSRRSRINTNHTLKVRTSVFNRFERLRMAYVLPLTLSRSELFTVDARFTSVIFVAISCTTYPKIAVSIAEYRGRKLALKLVSHCGDIALPLPHERAQGPPCGPCLQWSVQS